MIHCRALPCQKSCAAKISLTVNSGSAVGECSDACRKKPEAAVRPADDRAALRRAVAEVEAATAELSEASASVERAEVFLRCIEDDASKVSQISSAAAERSAKAISRGETPADDSDAIAKSIAVVGERRKHMQETIRLLKLQRDVAQQALARADRRVGEIINDIFIARADREAGRVARLWQELWNHYDRLAAMSDLWVQGGPLRLSPAAVTVLQKIGGLDDRFESTHVLSQVESEKSRSKSRHSARLRQWQQALRTDPDAELDE